MKALLKFIVLLFIASNMLAQTPTWTTYNNDNTSGSLPGVYSLATDASGNIWIGSYRSLVKYDQGTAWTVYNSSNSLLPNDATADVKDVAVDNSNNIWICTYASGLHRFNGTSWQQYLPSNSGILSNYTYCVGFDTPGNVWMGIYPTSPSNAGVVKWDKGSNWTPYTFTDTYNYKNVEAIAKDNSGNIWCGTNIGLYKFNPTNSTWTVYTKENTSGGLGGNWVRVIATDAAGNIWLGTMDKVNDSWVGTGLTKYTPSTNLWSNYIANSQDPNSKVVSAIAFRNTDVWVGTGFCGQYNGNGLYKLSGSTWTNYVNDLSTFPTSCVNDLVVDKNNNLWIASGAGLTKVDFNPTAVEEYIETIPAQFTLSAYPNPFNPTTKIEFSIPTAGKYTIKVYNTLGQEVTMLVDHELVAGVHSVTFDACGLASGIYVCKLSGDNINLSKKIVLMK